jgi:hypothetical protein
MLKKSASFVLASFRPSTYPRGYAFGPSLAAALLDVLDGLFEHPAGVVSSCSRHAGHRSAAVPKWFFRSLLEQGNAAYGDRLDCKSAIRASIILVGLG